MHSKYPEKFKQITTNVTELRKMSHQVDINDPAAVENCKVLAKQMEDLLLIDPAAPLTRHNIIGYGLSARQLTVLEGKDSPRLSVVILPGAERVKPVKLAMINPQILKTNRVWRYRGEGCLSFPGLYHNTTRYLYCTVGFIDLETMLPREMDFGGVEAVVMQHEIDHHDGKVFTEYANIPVVKDETPGPNDPCPQCFAAGKTLKWKKCSEHNLS